MPHWDFELDLSDFYHNPELPWFKKRDIIVGRIKGEPWYNNMDLVDLILDLATTETVQEFDQVWDLFYDYADDNRIWVKTR